jgi:hypothetical protein
MSNIDPDHLALRADADQPETDARVGQRGSCLHDLVEFGDGAFTFECCAFALPRRAARPEGSV